MKNNSQKKFSIKNFMEIAKSIIGLNYKIEFMTQQGKYIKSKGYSATEWFLNDVRHRENGPAIEWHNGCKEWWLNGKLHRLNQPAIQNSKGDKYWYQHNELHRDNDLPAVECANGDRFWFQRNKLHRLNAPAVIRANGEKEWHVNGLLHRENGPAFEGSEGSKCFWLNGTQYTEAEFNQYLTKKIFKESLQSNLEKPNMNELQKSKSRVKI